ncbi:MAG: hypothetical protein LBJ92_04770 [Holosporales bacterium]|nr:hypothetical protein [Holosporales bacterium]
MSNTSKIFLIFTCGLLTIGESTAYRYSLVLRDLHRLPTNCTSGQLPPLIPTIVHNEQQVDEAPAQPDPVPITPDQSQSYDGLQVDEATEPIGPVNVPVAQSQSYDGLQVEEATEPIGPVNVPVTQSQSYDGLRVTGDRGRLKPLTVTTEQIENWFSVPQRGGAVVPPSPVRATLPSLPVHALAYQLVGAIKMKAWIIRR